MKDNYEIFKEKVGISYADYYKAKYKKFIWFSYKFVKQQADAEEVVTDGFLNAIKYIHNFDQTKKIDTWVLTIIRNVITQKANKRSKKKEFFYQDYDVDENENNILSFQIPWDSGDYEKEYEEEIQKKFKIVKHVIENLPEKYKEVMVLREFNGWDYETISEKTGLTLQVVKNRLLTGRELVRRNYNIYINKKW